MSYQSVGKPKFYIDYLSYWQAKGNIDSVLIEGVDTPSIIGLNPSEYINRDLINKNVYLFYKSPTTKVINFTSEVGDYDCLLIYRGEISRLKFDDKSIQITAEDKTQIKIAELGGQQQQWVLKYQWYGQQKQLVDSLYMGIFNAQQRNE